MIYITDKVNISANARRTFIEVTDNDSLEFLKLLAEFVNIIYDTRYALSNYASAKAKQEVDKERLQKLKIEATENLKKLAKEEVQLVEEVDDVSFNDLSITEKKKIVKKKLSYFLDAKIKEFIKELNDFCIDSVLTDFTLWLQNHDN